MIDIELTRELDIIFSAGDIKSTRDIHTAIITALFTDRDKTWFRDNTEGSELYKTYQAKISNILFVDIKAYIKNSLSFLLEEKLANNISVKLNLIRNSLSFFLEITKTNGELLQLTYKI